MHTAQATAQGTKDPSSLLLYRRTKVPGSHGDLEANNERHGFRHGELSNPSSRTIERSRLARYFLLHCSPPYTKDNRLRPLVQTSCKLDHFYNAIPSHSHGGGNNTFMMTTKKNRILPIQSLLEDGRFPDKNNLSFTIPTNFGPENRPPPPSPLTLYFRCQGRVSLY